MPFGMVSLSGRLSFQRNIAVLALSESSCKALFEMIVFPYLDGTAVSITILRIGVNHTDSARAIGSTVS